MDKKTVAVFFGSKSTEHDVSIVTAIASIIDPLEATGTYNVIPVYIAKSGVWYVHEELKDIRTYSSGRIEKLLEMLKPVDIEITANGLGLVTPKRPFGKQTLHVDVAFPATHGTYGEDGSLMGLLRMTNTPFVGCGMEASVLAMNKLLAHKIVETAGVKAPKYVGLAKADYTAASIEHIETNLHYPMFVKPVHLGSSIGISRVVAAQELKEAVNLAFSYDAEIIIEEAVQNLIEVTVPIMSSTTDLTLGLVERPMFKADETFDFEKKYMNQGKGKMKSGGAKTSGSQGYSELPAKLSKTLYATCESTAVAAYKAVGCYGIARIDLLIDSATETVYFNEINPLPGSLYMHNWRAAGMSSTALVEKLIASAISRQEQQESIDTVFASNFLKQF